MNKKVIKQNVKNWLRTQKLGDLRIGFRNDFEFDGDGSDNDYIYIAHEDGDYSRFLKLCKELGYSGDLNVKTLCFLHELGHHFTCGDFDDLEEESDQMWRKELYKMLKSGDELKEEIALILYYRMPQEIAATEWAIEFATEHPIKARRLEKALCLD